MSLQVKRGDTASNNSYIGPPGSFSYDWERRLARIHDGILPGGYEIPCHPAVGSGPGKLLPLIGDFNEGYFGVVPKEELFDVTELSGQVSLLEGYANGGGVDWFKFALNKKVLFIPTQPLRIEVSWDTLFQKGLVFGEAVAVKGGQRFKVRLPTGADQLITSIPEIYDPIGPEESEWNRLLYRVCEENPPTQHLSNWDSYPSVSGMLSQIPCWCQETHQSSADLVILRGGEEGLGMFSAKSRSLKAGWRPVLELIV